MKSLLVLLCIPIISLGQNKTQREFDKFDSVLKNFTLEKSMREYKIEKLVGHAVWQAALTDQKVKDSLFSDAAFLEKAMSDEIIKDMGAPDLFFKAARFITFKNKKPKTTNLSLYVLTTLKEATVFDRSTIIKVIFNDDTIKEYYNEASLKTWGRDEVAKIYFTVPPNDPLRTKPVTAIRLAAKGLTLDIDVPRHKSNTIVEMINLVEKESTEL